MTTSVRIDCPAGADYMVAFDYIEQGRTFTEYVRPGEERVVYIYAAKTITRIAEVMQNVLKPAV